MAIKKGLNNYWYLTTNHHSILANRLCINSISFGIGIAQDVELKY